MHGFLSGCSSWKNLIPHIPAQEFSDTSHFLLRNLYFLHCRFFFNRLCKIHAFRRDFAGVFHNQSSVERLIDFLISFTTSNGFSSRGCVSFSFVLFTIDSFSCLPFSAFPLSVFAFSVFSFSALALSMLSFA